jgi:hypothetical protein
MVTVMYIELHMGFAPGGGMVPSHFMTLHALYIAYMYYIIIIERIFEYIGHNSWADPGGFTGCP